MASLKSSRSIEEEINGENLLTVDDKFWSWPFEFHLILGCGLLFLCSSLIVKDGLGMQLIKVLSRHTDCKPYNAPPISTHFEALFLSLLHLCSSFCLPWVSLPAPSLAHYLPVFQLFLQSNSLESLSKGAGVFMVATPLPHGQICHCICSIWMQKLCLLLFWIIALTIYIYRYLMFCQYMKIYNYLINVQKCSEFKHFLSIFFLFAFPANEVCRTDSWHPFWLHVLSVVSSFSSSGI